MATNYPSFPSTATLTNLSSSNITASDAVVSNNINVGSLTSSQDSLINGLTVGRGKGSISNNTAFGISSLGSNTSGVANVAIGNNALSGNTGGAFNVALGSQALQANPNGLYNTAIGRLAYFSLLSGDSNIALGFRAGQSATSLLNGVIIGGNNGSTINGTTGSIIISDGAGNIRLTANSSGNVLVPSGSLIISGGLTVSGNVVLGDAADDSITSTAQLTASNGISASFYRLPDGTRLSSSTQLGGGGVSYWSEALNISAPNTTVPASSWTPNTTASNADAVIAPKNDGALLAAVPDNAGGGGGGVKRGAKAVDLSRYRDLASQVAAGTLSTIGGGRSNTAADNYTTVGGGYYNTAGFLGSTIGGGESNSTANNAGYAVVAGGNNNAVGKSYGVVGGGRNNAASGADSTIAGGNGNTASGDGGTVGGGTGNTASGTYASVAGGLSNVAGSYAEAVGGGRYSYNFGGTANSWVSTDALWTLGNGTGTGAASSNAITTLKNAKTGIGLGQSKPTEMLDVGGNVKFSGALMPNNTAGNAGQVLTSAGADLPPTWGSASYTASTPSNWSGSAPTTLAAAVDRLAAAVAGLLGTSIP